MLLERSGMIYLPLTRLDGMMRETDYTSHKSHLNKLLVSNLDPASFTQAVYEFFETLIIRLT
ncbi:MAG TPA: hypothetical protein V6D15_01915 [Oculatellaceae cyanobacterium]|jgi:hypothetical protein